MSSSRRRFVVRHPVVVDIGCSCRRPNLSSFFSSSLPKFRLPVSHDPFSPSTTTTISTNSLWDTSRTATTASSPLTSSPSLPRYSVAESPKWRPRKKTGKAKKKGVVEESVAVVKESSDPYLDFRDSMHQMIVEMEIYAWEDLRDLLRRFLALNSPSHHHLILQAFAEIWTAVFSAPSSSSTGASASASASFPGRAAGGGDRTLRPARASRHVTRSREEVKEQNEEKKKKDRGEILPPPGGTCTGARWPRAYPVG